MRRLPPRPLQVAHVGTVFFTTATGRCAGMPKVGRRALKKSAGAAKKSAGAAKKSAGAAKKSAAKKRAGREPVTPRTPGTAGTALKINPQSPWSKYSCRGRCYFYNWDTTVFSLRQPGDGVKGEREEEKQKFEKDMITARRMDGGELNALSEWEARHAGRGGRGSSKS